MLISKFDRFIRDQIKAKYQTHRQANFRRKFQTPTPPPRKNKKKPEKNGIKKKKGRFSVWAPNCNATLVCEEQESKRQSDKYCELA